MKARLPGYTFSGKWGLIEDLLKGTKYTHIIGGPVFGDEAEPTPHYDPTIDKHTSDYDKGLMKAGWDQTHNSYYMKRGIL